MYLPNEQKCDMLYTYMHHQRACITPQLALLPKFSNPRARTCM